MSQKFIPLILWAISFDHNFIFNTKFLKEVYCSIEYIISEVQKFAWPLAFLSHSVGVVALSGISHVACRVACEQQMYFLSWLNSLPLKNNVCEPERQNDFHDTESFALMLANQNKGWNTARVTPHDLARLHVLDFGKSYQICFWNMNFTTITRFPATSNANFLWKNYFLSYVCDGGLWFCFIKYGSMWHKQNPDKIIATVKGK